MSFAKKVPALVLVASLLSLSACVTTSTPTGVIKGAYVYVQKDKFKKFSKLLAGEAAQQWSNITAFENLKKDLDGDAKAFSISKPALLSEVKPSKDTVIRTYRSNVIKSGTPIFQAVSSCTTGTRLVVGHLPCSPADRPCIEVDREEVTQCRIIELERL